MVPDHSPSTDERASLVQPSQSSSSLECTSHLGFSLVDSNRSFDDIVQLLVGEDLNLYRKLIDSLQLKKYHLAPLAGMPDQPWAMKAILAMNAGYSVNDIIEATILAGGLWTGSESEMWAGWRRRFEALNENEETDSRIFDLARRGAKAMSEREEQAQNRDRYRAVHGVQ